MGEVRWTAEAARWLEEIHDYIANDSAETARRVVREIYNRAGSLSSFPERGYRYRDDPESDVRIVLWGHYRIAYLIREDRDVDVLGVFHGALDVRRYLQGTSDEPPASDP